MDLPDALCEAVVAVQSMRQHGARTRQMQYIGKLMRQLDSAALRTVREAFNLMYNLEQSCRIQLDALAAVGRAGVTLIPDAVVERTRQQVNRPRGEQEYRDWPALLRMLDRRGVDFRG